MSRLSPLKLVTLVTLLALAAATSALLACADNKSWWEKSGACPEGATIERDGSDVFCVASGVKDGRFERYAADGSVALLSGAYKNGKRDGTWTQRTSTGEVLGTFELAEGVGTAMTWRDDGPVETEAEVVGDVFSGRWVRYQAAASGSIKIEEGRYEAGKAIGTWFFRDAAGQTIREVDYRDGEIWETRNFENGELAHTQLSDAAQKEADERAAALATRVEDQARAAGVLGALARQQGGAFASLTGTADFSSGIDDKNIYGGLLGNEVGEMKGGFGFGVRGTDSGGGGTGWGTIGTGKVGTLGRGGGGGGVGYGTGSGRLGRRATPNIRAGATTVKGALDKNIIRRYIRRRYTSFRFCYEKELVAKPSLKGTTVLQMIIAPSGSVVSASASGMGNKNVESCIARGARTIVFPKPPGGGSVSVRTSFSFSAAAATPTSPAGKAPAATKKPALEGGGAVKRRGE